MSHLIFDVDDISTGSDIQKNETSSAWIKFLLSFFSLLCPAWMLGFEQSDFPKTTW